MGSNPTLSASNSLLVARISYPLPSGERDRVRGDKYPLYTILSAPRKDIFAECFLMRRLEYNYRQCNKNVISVIANASEAISL